MTYYIISLGCSKNLVDSEKINNSMFNAGYLPVGSSEQADIIIINTCGFITPAKEESLDVIFDAVEYDSKYIAVAGCLSQRYMDQLKKDIPEIDFIYGIPDEHFVRSLSRSLDIVIKESPPSISRKALYKAQVYSYIKISDGCSNNCSYCAIPLIRGGHRSFSIESILSDAEKALSEGAKELNIIAQDITQYRHGKYRLPHLIEKISEIDEVQWIRLLYCHPDHINNDIIGIYRNDKVVRYIDIPFQHVSRKILNSMGRNGDFNKYYDLVMKLRDEIPGIRIRSTFLLGYPGEDENDFRMILDFLRKTELDRVGAFIYSKEEDTEAYKLKGQIPESVKKKRYEEFMEIQKDISFKNLRRLIGSEVSVIVEEKFDETTYLARTEFDAPEVDGIFYLTAKDEVNNSIVRAKVIGSEEYDLFGEII